MGVTRKDALRILGGSAVGAGLTFGAPATAASAGRPPEIDRDVCVIGGGGSGTYTAIRLRDLGQRVVLVERNDRLGGHCETFHDPVTGRTTDIGVVVFHNLQIVKDYFARFDVPLTTSPGATGVRRYVDFRSGTVVPGYTPPAPAALPAYLALLQQYPYLEAGFDLPDPVPPVLLQPFGDVVRQFGLESIVPLLFAVAQGLGDILRQPAIYVMKNFGIDVLRNSAARSFLTTARANNSELYEKATAFLGDDVLLCAGVTGVQRDRHGVRVHVVTPHGPRIIRCRKLVVTIPPLLRNLAGFDLDRTERALFRRFRSGFYWTGVVRLSGLPEDHTLQGAAADTPYNLLPLPGLYSVSATPIPGLRGVKYGSTVPLTDRQVRANIAADLDRLRTAGTAPVRLERFEIFRSHNPFELTVSPQDIAGGFYRDLYALQGRNRTFYNGAAFHTHDSSLLWQFTERLLPLLTT
jgi:hypothetical protein